jgi:hypothetical protein
MYFSADTINFIKNQIINNVSGSGFESKIVLTCIGNLIQGAGITLTTSSTNNYGLIANNIFNGSNKNVACRLGGNMIVIGNIFTNNLFELLRK